MRNILHKLSFLLILFTLLFSLVVEAQSIRLDASKLAPQVGVSLSPRASSFVEGSTFDISILLDTKDISVNGVEIKLNFDANKLEIIKPSSGRSIVGVWVEPPNYDNTRGTASYVGVIPDGITTSSGLIGTISFRAKNTGQATLSFSSDSKVLINDGQGTEASVNLARAEYAILTKAPEGVVVFSETHSFQSNWYNNNNPIISWERDVGVSEFSYVLDNKPSTVPDNKTDTDSTSISFEDLDDGLWYFHIKANKNGAWGTSGHFLMRIDTTPPARFKPQVNYLATASLSERALVSFFTTDNLSGVDHYEVGIIDKSQPSTISPVFVQTESPFQIPITGGNLSAVVRVFDKAGNIREVSIAIRSLSPLRNFLTDRLVYILSLIILAGLISLAVHYLVGHHILRYLRKAIELIKKEERMDNRESKEDE